MKSKLTFLLSSLFLTASASFAAISITVADRLGLSAAEPSQTIAGVEVLAGDMAVWSHADNKKASAITMTFPTTAPGEFTVIDADSILGGTDPNPNAYMAYLEITESGTYDFTATSSGNITSSSQLYILRADSGKIVFLATDAEEYADNADTMLNLSYSWDSSYDAVVIIEAANADRGWLSPQDTTIDYSNINDGGDPVTYLPGYRLHASAETSGTSFGSKWNFEATTDPTDIEKNRNRCSVMGMAFAEAGGGPFTLTPGEYLYDTYLSWTYGNTPEIGQSLMLGWVYVSQHPVAIYSYKLGWLLYPVGEANTGLFFYRFSTSNWIWTSENYGGFYWDYASSSWESAL